MFQINVPNNSKERPWKGRSWKPVERLGQLEVELGLQLDQSGRGIPTQERTQNAGRGVDGANHLSKVARADVIDRLIEAGVIEDVKELDTQAKLCLFR